MHVDGGWAHDLDCSRLPGCQAALMEGVCEACGVKLSRYAPRVHAHLGGGLSPDAACVDVHSCPADTSLLGHKMTQVVYG